MLSPAATVTDAVNGAWSYTWASGDLTLVGDYWVEAQVTFSSGAIQTFGPVVFTVMAQLA